MQAKPLMVLVMTCGVASSVAAEQLQTVPSRDRLSRAPSLERWADRLANEVDHLQEDLYYERGDYPRELIRQAERTSQAVAHFQQVARRASNEEHLIRDFQEMDQQVHQLVEQLNQSGNNWLSRQASRILYADEQLHYLLRGSAGGGDGRGAREVLARHAHVLETQAKQLEQLVDRVYQREPDLYEAIREFADAAEHFHQVVERGADREHLVDDFQNVDDAWHRAVNRVNASRYGLYLRRVAQRVNRVHNQIHVLLDRSDHGGRLDDHDQHEAARRPQIEFELPGIGRFQLR